MGKKRKKRRSGKRRKERKQRQDRTSEETPNVRSRHLSDFSGKARRGDLAEVRATFSGIPVPVEDRNNPSKGLEEKTDLARHNRGDA